MLTIPPSVKIFVAAKPADMRRGFDGLAALVREVFDEDPLNGHLFVFCNKRADRVKILWWDRSGFCLWYKRIERGRFRFPASERSHIQMEAATLSLILEGIDLTHAKHRRRFVPRQCA